MTREEKFDLLSRYVDDDLRPGDDAAVERLLREDPEFAGLLADLSLQHALLHRVGRTESHVRPAARRARRHARPPSSLPWLWAGAAAAAASLLLVLAASLSRPPDPARTEVVRQDPAPEPEPRPEPPPPPPKPPVPPPIPDSRFPIPPPPVPPPAPKPPEPPPPAPPPPVPEPPALRETLVTVATLDRVEGEVWIVDASGADKGRAQAGHVLVDGEGVRAGGRASLTFHDGTRLDLEEGGLLRGLTENPGKRAVLSRGSLTADVPAQPPGKPLVLATPNAQTTVLGTRFTLTALADSTRLEVRQGKVRLQRSSDRAAIDVSGGQFAVAAAGSPLAAQPLRTSNGLLALYLFEEGKGALVHDTARNGPALDLRIETPSAVRWLPGALQVHSPAVISSLRPAAKIADACRRSNELSVEAWIRPARTTTIAPPHPGRIVSLSSDINTRNFTLEQGSPPSGGADPCFNLRLRTTATNDNGYPPIFRTPNGTARTQLTHLVCTRTASGTAALYVDGASQAESRAFGGNLSNWNAAYPLLLADEQGGARPWVGEVHLLAVYGRALDPEEVRQNFRAGSE